MKLVRLTGLVTSLALIAAIGLPRFADATEVRTSGKIEVPAGSAGVAICTDPVMQSVLNDDLWASRRGLQGAPLHEISITVTVTQKLLQPGVGLSDLFPGDQSVVDMMKDAGAEVPPLGDSGSKQLDPYAENARRQATLNEDPITAQFRSYQALRESVGNGNPYEKMADKIYDTVIIARATVGGLSGELIVVAVVHGGDDVHQAKKLVAEEIANALLH